MPKYNPYFAHRVKCFWIYTSNFSFHFDSMYTNVGKKTCQEFMDNTARIPDIIVDTWKKFNP